MAATRPDICAEPMFRAPRPEMVSESTLTGPLLCGFAGCGVCASAAEPKEKARIKNDDESRRERIVFMTGNPSIDFGMRISDFGLRTDESKPSSKLPLIRIPQSEIYNRAARSLPFAVPFRGLTARLAGLRRGGLRAFGLRAFGLLRLDVRGVGRALHF